MVEETDRIKQHIDNERGSLDRNLDEIEYRFKDATDVKGHFKRHTGWILAATAAGGFLLSLAVGKSSQSADAARQTDPEETPPTMTGPSASFVSEHLNNLSETLNNVVAGLVGVFSEKLCSFVADAVPGFREQYNNIKQKDTSSVHSMRSNVGR